MFVPAGSGGINKPFDRILKAFADEAPALFLRLLGLVPAGVEPEIEPLRPETAPPMVFPDYVALVRGGPAGPVIFHAEFQSNYHQNLPRDMARYGGSLAWQYQMRVISVLVMLRPDRAPAEVPEEGHYTIGSTHTTHAYKVIRLWEVDPEPVLETNNPKLLPWALLMKSTDEQVREIASIVARQDDDEALGRFLTLGSVRYHRNVLEGMIGGGKMGLIRAILDGSNLVQEERDQAAAEGLARGQVTEARRFLRLLVRKRFPELASMTEIDAISDAAILESITENALDSGDASSIRSAILIAARSN